MRWGRRKDVPRDDDADGSQGEWLSEPATADDPTVVEETDAAVRPDDSHAGEESDGPAPSDTGEESDGPLLSDGPDESDEPGETGLPTAPAADDDPEDPEDPSSGLAATSAPAPTAVRGDKRRRATRPRALGRSGLLLVLPALLLLAVVTLWPLGRAVVESLYRSSLVTPDDRTFVALETYASVLSSGTWWTAVGVTLAFVAAAVVLQLFLATLFATTLRRLTHGTRWLGALLLVPFGLLSVVAATSWRDALTTGFGPVWFGYDGESTAAAWTALLASEVWRGTGITTLILLAGLTRVSPALLEAALADGANGWQRFWRVTRPAAAPAIAVAVLYRALDAFRVLEAPLVAEGEAVRTVSLLAWDTTFGGFELGLGATVSVLLLLLAALLGGVLAALLRLRRTL